MKTLFVGTVVAALGVMGGYVYAEDDKGGPFSIGGRGMYYAPQDGDSSWSGGVQGRLRLPLFFAAEASVDYRSNDAAGSSIDVWPVQLSLLAYVLPEILRMQPFLIAGGGWYHTTVENPGGSENTDSRFGPHVGAGLEFNLTSKWFLDATYRYVWIEKFESVDANLVPHNVDDSGSMVTFGVNYRF